MTKDLCHNLLSLGWGPRRGDYVRWVKGNTKDKRSLPCILEELQRLHQLPACDNCTSGKIVAWHDWLTEGTPETMLVTLCCGRTSTLPMVARQGCASELRIWLESLTLFHQGFREWGPVWKMDSKPLDQERKRHLQQAPAPWRGQIVRENCQTLRK